MPVERPTFSESWYRVSPLRVRLRASVQAVRQHFRGDLWHVLRDPANDTYFRLNAPAYQFVGLLDGRRSVADAWRICSGQLGDAAPTQGEAISLLGQLYSANLLQADIPPDAESLFQRYKTRRRREIQGFLTNLLFLRIPLLDPDRFLRAFLPALGWIFSWAGLLVWGALVAGGLYAIAGSLDRLADRAQGVLDVANLPLLYVGMAIAKVFHEFGHALACKKFGRQEGAADEVHAMGIMLLIFTPIPYVDVSGSWTFRSKWRRAMVGAAGMWVELALAGVAAMVWARTSQGTALNAVAYNIMFIASVSTVLFNGNPLLRYDAYYILSDLLEIPNLAQRSKEYIYYLVRKYAWGVRQVRCPAHTPGERPWMLFYGVASFLYRMVVCVAILLFVSEKLPVVGAVLAAAAIVAWVFVPLGKFVHYLSAGPELARTRRRAVLSTVATLAVLVGAIGLIPAPDRARVEGVVEPVDMAFVHAGEDGFLREALPTGTDVRLDGPPLVRLENPELQAELAKALAKLEELQDRRRLQEANSVAGAQILAEQVSAAQDAVGRLRQRVAALEVRAPLEGQWTSPKIDQMRGAYVHRGDRLGLVARTDRLCIRAMADQQVAALLIAEARPDVEIQVQGRPDPNRPLAGRIDRILPAGTEQLPSAALGYLAGGSIATSSEDREGLKASEKLFEIVVAPEPREGVRLLSGQRVVVRFDAARKPLAIQWWRWALQVFQKRMRVA